MRNMVMTRLGDFFNVGAYAWQAVYKVPIQEGSHIISGSNIISRGLILSKWSPIFSLSQIIWPYYQEIHLLIIFSAETPQVYAIGTSYQVTIEFASVCTQRYLLPGGTFILLPLLLLSIFLAGL